VTDQTGAAVANAFIAVTNIDAGITRTATTEESGVYRVPLLPLGTYRITAEAANFKKVIRDGIPLATGQTATIDLSLEAGEIHETVTVSSDTSLADAGKTDIGRVMNSRDVHNLPLISRNPINFGILQTNVNGRAKIGLAFPNFNVNGYLRRVNYQLDGNTNTQADHATVRFMVISETYVSEVQLVTNGFAAEFGNTPGMIMNVVTPSGTNRLRGAAAYSFRRSPFYSRPFFYPGNDLGSNKSDNFTATIGGPIIKDRWHFYFGYEKLRHEEKAINSRVLTISDDDKRALIAAGLSPSIFPPAIPYSDRGFLFLFRTDAQLNGKNRLSVRFNHSNLPSTNFINGGLNTLERAVDVVTIDYGLAAQIVTYTPQVLNEFRFQYGQRRNSGNTGRRNQFSGTGPSVAIDRVANFGSPTNADEPLPPIRITQVQDNVTRTMGTHIIKFGGGFNVYNVTERSPLFSLYTFPSIAAYLDARRNPVACCYTQFSQTLGDPQISYKATYWNLFVQDDWKVTFRLKVNFGLRYDLYGLPAADPNSPFPASRQFHLDKNNFAPRVGIAYALREGERPTVLRFGAGFYFDQPLLAMYQRAIQNNGDPKYYSLTFRPGDVGAPIFPNTLSGSTPPPGSAGQNIDTVASDFVNMYAIHSNVQLEQAITNNLSVSVGYVHSGGRHIPVYRNTNPINPVSYLADGRPVFDTDVNAHTRLDPRFNVIQMVESAGVSEYNALNLQLTHRYSHGLQFSAGYTLSKSTDDAPEQNTTTGNIKELVLSDPTRRALDKGASFADQRHTFYSTLVARPRFEFANRTLSYLFNNNQVSIIALANSGETFNITCKCDVNHDGIDSSDRPVGIKRNAGTTPPQFNLDLRYSRFFDISERYKFEVFADFTNLFNINSIVGFNRVTVTADSHGQLTGPLPNFRSLNASTAQDSRQFQLGFKFSF